MIRDGRTDGFDDFVKVPLGMEDAPRPTYDPVSIGHQTGTLGRAALEDVEDVPDDVEGELRLAEPHTEAEEGRLAGRGAIAVLGGPQPGRSDEDHLLRT